MDQPKQSSKLRSFSIVSSLTLVSRITGLGRDALMASMFGTGWILDAFSLAFRLPNMFRRLFGEGALTAAFLPEFVRISNKDGHAAAVDLFSGVGWRLAKLLMGFCLVMEATIGLAYLTLALSERSALLCQLTMLLIPFMLLICMSGFYVAALNGVQHFTLPALAPVLLNVVWFLGGVLAAKTMDSGTDEVKLIAISILVGGCLQLVLLARKAAKYEIRLRRPSQIGVERSGVVFKAMAPVLIGLSISQVNGLVDSVLAWVLSSGNMDAFPDLHRFRLPEGTTGALYLGQRLYQFPMGVFAVALGTVLFPRFAAHAQAGDTTQLSRDVIHGLQLVMVVGIPASVGLWIMAPALTELLFRYGRFDAIAGVKTSDMIAAHGLGVWVFSGLLIVNRVFYAANDQMTPMRLGLACVGLNLIFNIVLLPIMGATALPIASILATIFQLGLSLEILRKRFLQVGRNALLPVLLRVIVCSIPMLLAIYWALGAVQQYETQLRVISFRIVHVVAPIAVAIIVYWMGLVATGVSPRKLLKGPRV